LHEPSRARVAACGRFVATDHTLRGPPACGR
jgi:hypothetical protein